jgi:type I restriction enzyme S subunit
MKTRRIVDAEDRITELAIRSSATNLLPSGAVLIVTRSGILAHSLPVAVTQTDAAINQDLKALVPYAGLDPEYVAWALGRFANDILVDCRKHGTTVHSIETSRLLKFPIPVCPTNEQRRIVEKIDELFSLIEAGERALERARRLLERYRQSILKAAVTGELTRDWRERHKGEVEPADILLNEGQSPDKLGRSVIYRGEIEGCCLQKTLLRFRATEGVRPEFAHIVFRHYMHSGRFRRIARITTNIGHNTRVRFVAMEFRIPPAAEQAEIVDRVLAADANLRHLGNDLSMDIGTALRQSILTAAFSGKLVPQDAADEPASALLARLHAERLGAGESSGKRGPRARAVA